jgi:hypothetical protein
MSFFTRRHSNTFGDTGSLTRFYVAEAPWNPWIPPSTVLALFRFLTTSSRSSV